MSFCKNCGSELKKEDTICSSCGAKVNNIDAADLWNSAKNQAKNVSEKLTDESGKLKLFDALNSLGNNKNLFLCSLAGIVINLILHFTGNIKYDFWLISGEKSVFGVISLLQEYDGNSFYDLIKGILNLGPILIALSIILMIMPLILNKPYRSKTFTVSKIALIYSFIAQLAFYALVIAAYADIDGAVSITFGGFACFIESVLEIIIIFKLSKSIKKSVSKAIENETESLL